MNYEQQVRRQMEQQATEQQLDCPIEGDVDAALSNINEINKGGTGRKNERKMRVSFQGTSLNHNRKMKAQKQRQVHGARRPGSKQGGIGKMGHGRETSPSQI